MRLSRQTMPLILTEPVFGLKNGRSPLVNACVRTLHTLSQPRRASIAAEHGCPAVQFNSHGGRSTRAWAAPPRRAQRSAAGGSSSGAAGGSSSSSAGSSAGASSSAVQRKRDELLDAPLGFTGASAAPSEVRVRSFEEIMAEKRRTQAAAGAPAAGAPLALTCMSS